MAGVFDDMLRSFFQCEDGAFSVVTTRESEVDSQITVTGHEKKVVADFFSEIHRGSVKALTRAGIDPGRKFKLYPTGQEIELNLVYPKPNKSELRLYLRSDQFRPDPTLVWFVFRRGSELWIGALDPATFSAAQKGQLDDNVRPALLDINDTAFQEALYGPPSGYAYEETVKRIRRDPNIARVALQRSGYVCEMRPDLETFVSRVGCGAPYLEAHHLIPLSQQPYIPHVKLDIVDNIVILNPWSHRLLHHGLFEEVAPHVRQMSEKREALLSAVGISADDVVGLYGAQN